MEREKDSKGNGSQITAIAYRLKLQDLRNVEPEIYEEFLLNFESARGDEELRRKAEDKLESSIKNLQEKRKLSSNFVYTIMAKQLIRRQIT